jgi:twitching motility protein PilI
MADQEGLKDLQARLAERLQAAQTQSRRASWLAVETAGAPLLFPLAGAGEIFPVPPLLPMPHTKPWFAGVANLRGGLHGVVDLGAFLGLRAAAQPVAGARDQARVVALNAALGSHCALLVDRLAGLRSVDQLSAEPAATQALPSFAGGCWRDAEGRVWQEIDLAALATHDQFLGIAA